MAHISTVRKNIKDELATGVKWRAIIKKRGWKSKPYDPNRRRKEKSGTYGGHG